jgi:tetratricopeptide (TPR) repeat protein
MTNHSLTAKRIFLNACLMIATALALSTTTIAWAQQTDYDAERERAFGLYEQNKFAEVIPILEKLVKIKTDDSAVWMRLGWATMVVSDSIKDPAQRAAGRERAKAAFLRAQELGDDSNLLQAGLAHVLGPDVSDQAFSRSKEADAAMREGEEAHSRGDLDKALAKYLQALELDPKLYEAALYAGDMEYKKGYNSTDPKYRSAAVDRAGGWFAKAIAIDANRETAYRYWGDALDMIGKTDLARDKFVEAIIAEPYGRSAYVGLSQWGDRHKVDLGHPQIDIPSNVSSNKPGEINITIDDLTLKGNDDGSAAWLMYGIARSQWMNKKDGTRSDKFAKAYPNETAYRHSLAEEADALHLVVISLKEQTKGKQNLKLTPSLEHLAKLNDAGLLEAYILFAKVDQGIARDYEAYRAANHEKLRRYWLEVAINK